MKNRRLFVGVIVLVLVSMVAPNVVASQPAPAGPTHISQMTECEEDLDGKTIIFYHFGDLSGAYSFISLPLVAGLNDAVDYFNENGGICGAEIAVEYRDTGGDTGKAQQFWDEFAAIEGEAAPKVIFLYSSADSELLRDQAEELQIPIMSASGSELALYGENADDPGWVFSNIPLYTDQFGLFCEYISENWDQFGIDGDPVIGHLSWAGAFGASSDTPNTRAYCESLGIGYAGAEYFLPTASSVAEQMQTLLDGGANIIYTTSLATGPVLVAKTISGAELQGQVLVAGTNWALDTSVIGLGGADVAGLVGPLPYLWYDDLDNAGVNLVLNTWLTKHLGPAGDDPEAQRAALGTRNIVYLLSFAVIDAYVEAMTITVNRVGYENLTGAAYYETLTGFEYAALDGVLTFSYSEDLRAPSSARIGQIQFVETDDGVFPTIAPLTDFRDTPDLRGSVELE